MKADFARPVDILLVEDNPGEVRLTAEALAEGRLPHRLSVVDNGEAAICYLRRLAPFEDSIRPDLILLDLNLPRKDGRQVLQEIKSHTELRRIPVVVLTTSRAQIDVETAYDLNANCYIQKLVDPNQFWEIIRAIEYFWLTLVTLPPSERSL